MKRPTFIIKDQMHGDISLTELEWQIIHTKLFQRLNYIRVLGPGFLTFPSANNTVFEHAIGTLKLASDIGRKISKCDLNLLRLCALLHPVGEVPFGLSMSEVAEKYGQKKEERTISALRISAELDAVLGNAKQEIVNAVERSITLDGDLFHKILYSTTPPIGANVLDFILRDQAFVGWTSGIVDVERVIREIQWIGNMPQLREITDIIDVIMVVLQTYYNRIYYLEPKRIADLMMMRLVDEVIQRKLADHSHFPFSIKSSFDLHCFLTFTDEAVLRLIKTLSQGQKDMKQAFDRLTSGKILKSLDLSKHFSQIFPELKEKKPYEYIDDNSLKEKLITRLRNLEEEICENSNLSRLLFYLDSPVIYNFRIFATSWNRIRQRLFPGMFAGNISFEKIKAYLPSECIGKIHWKEYFDR